MAVIASKRSIMTLYSGADDMHSHRSRIVLAEKGVTVDVLEVKEEKPEQLLEINPYGTFPTLIDRDLVLYDSSIIMEYLDERFPHPPLLPVYPVARAKSRMMMRRVDRDWYSLVELIQHGDEEEADAARKQLRESLIAIVPVFTSQPYFLSDDYTLVDSCIAPLLWRLPLLDVKLPPAKAKLLAGYESRLFEREAFQASLTEFEREIRD